MKLESLVPMRYFFFAQIPMSLIFFFYFFLLWAHCSFISSAFLGYSFHYSFWKSFYIRTFWKYLYYLLLFGAYDKFETNFERIITINTCVMGLYIVILSITSYIFKFKLFYYENIAQKSFYTTFSVFFLKQNV